ncbi:hypothetical protein [Azospirillum sp.]|uniref:hypothetical protein n=1 Tax=Azospirillum sp. TaxID=34012 RepID=UPI002D3B2295|nr:hypothetical protein [Azospirillum sp.]HYD65945.1 hypothetical protein [Azospirillum sp.]
MRTPILAASLVALLLAGPALADDQSDCVAGIEFIKAEIAKAPAQPTLDALKKQLRNAEREQREKEYDECLDAVKAARKAVAAK